jgi:hypothetical protein
MPATPDALSPAQKQFLSKTLGVAIPVPAVSGDLQPVWATAKAQADAQISVLQKALNASGFDIMQKVAQSGIDKLTEGPAKSLTQALSDYDKAGADAVGPVKSAVNEMRKVLEGDRIIAALDANPLKMPVSLRATLGGALDQIEASLG